MRRYLFCLAVSAIALIPTAAFAQDGQGFYVGLGAGASKVSDTEVTYYDVGGTFGGTGSQDRAKTQADLSTAAQFNGSLGFDFGTVRADLELSYARNKVNSITVVSVNGAPVTLDATDRQDVCDYIEATNCSGSGNTISFGSGPRLRQASAMANLWIDLPVGGVVVPYLGGGVGVVGFEMDGEGTGKFAWQAGAGVAFNLSKKISLTADFRHREVSGEDFPWDANSGFRVGRIKTNAASAGLRFRF